MRIIAGAAGGRNIVAPKGIDTRPTQDRVRESLFSILGPGLDQSYVLDLFAGSGALGLEALSRGAAYAVFVDKARAAQEAVLRNIEALGVSEHAKLLRSDWRAAIRTLEGNGMAFDLVFLDPPYKMADADELLEVLGTGRLLRPGALIVYEHAKKTPPHAAHFDVRDTRHYGDTAISFLAQKA